MKRWKNLGAAVATVIVGSLVISTPGSQAASETEPGALTSAQPSRDSLRAQLGLSPGERLVLKDVIRDRDGTVHRRYDRTLKGLPVIGGDLIVHRYAGGRIMVDWASQADLGSLGSTQPRVSPASAAQLAARSTQLRSTAADAELVVYAVGDTAKLAWRATASGPDARELVFVDANSGNRIAGWSDIHDADGRGKSLYSGRVRFKTDRQSATKFLMRDSSRGNFRLFDANNTENDPPTGTLMSDRDNVWGNFRASNRQSAAADIAYGHKVTWDFYKNTFNRDGIRNDGTTPRSYVHQGVNFENAYFDDQCYCMVYGDGGTTFRPLVSLDVVAHEMSHGTTAATANLIYLGESGGLNEATSDIFGSMAEFSASNPNDRGDYIIGEKLVKVAPHFLRRMDNPRLDAPLYGGAAHSYNCWTPTMGHDDVHFSSGPANHFFYLLAEGSGPKVIGGRNHNSPTCDGTPVNGIGKMAAGKIWYRALNVYMTSTSNYMVARDATIRAARDLFGRTSTQCARVVRAWNAVDAPAGSWTCASGPAFGANVVANPGFEAVPNVSWSATSGVITNSAAAFPRTGARYAYLGRVDGSIKTLEQEIIVPNSPNAKLRFWLLIFTEDAVFAAFDTVQVSVGGDLLDEFTNQDANNSYTRHTFDMAPYAGDTVTLRFESVNDVNLPTHFLIDDVSVTPN